MAGVQVSEVPQTQGAALTASPKPLRQAGAVKAHRQASESVESQEPVEDGSVLKYRSPPLLLLLRSKHPRGYS